MNKGLFLFILSLLVLSNCFSQEYSFSNKPLMFWHEKTKQIMLIENDSILIKTNQKIRERLNKTDYPSILSEYIPFNIKGKNYFVHEGCGPVLEFRNDSIVRIDNSFLHKNQFRAVSFVYNDEIYFLGGYGLFTFKNILVKFDFKTKEWFEVKYSGEYFPSVVGAYSKIIKNKLYVFGGLDENNQLNKSIYILNLDELKWEKNYLTNGVLEYYNFDSCLEAKTGLIFHNQKNLVYLDFKKNSFSKFKINAVEFYTNSIYNDSIIYYIRENNVNITQKYFFNKVSLNELLKSKISEEKLFNKYDTIQLIITIFTLFTIIVILIFRYKFFLLYILNFNYPFIFQQSSNKLIYKGKLVKELNSDDIKILKLINRKKDEYISLNEFNDLFANDLEKENYAAIIKRREKKIESFVKMVSNKTGFEISEFVFERKNEHDKRIKEIKILPKLIKFI